MESKIKHVEFPDITVSTDGEKIIIHPKIELTELNCFATVVKTPRILNGNGARLNEVLKRRGIVCLTNSN